MKSARTKAMDPMTKSQDDVYFVSKNYLKTGNITIDATRKVPPPIKEVNPCNILKIGLVVSTIDLG